SGGGIDRLVGLVLLVFLVVLGGGCGGATPEEMASLAAKGYYEHLMRGEYRQFLEGKYFVPLDTIGTIDRMEEHEVNLRQFMAQQEKEHHGIREVRISNAKTDTVQKVTNVFLVLCYGDSINEEIVVPMVEREGKWRMK
ncbi:MAG: hypothetical protein J5931_06110, partial [Prevotella sp.]|nr:hypothetical protein [Prevotella sp.]